MFHCIKERFVGFVNRQRHHLANLQEASFDRGEQELFKILDDEKLIDRFPATIPMIALLVWGFILTFPLVIVLHSSHFSADRLTASSVVEYYVPLLMTFFVFVINQKILVPKCFFKKKYFKFIVGNALILLLSVFVREIFVFIVSRDPSETWNDFFSTSIFFQRHFSPWVIVSLGISLGVVSTCSILISVFSRQVVRAFVIRERSRARIEYELDFLKQQLSPHFLFNTLNNISSLITIDPKLAERSMQKLSQLLRVTLYQTEDKFITLREEMDILEKYADLEKLRHDENFEFIFEKNIENPNQAIEPLLLMPLLENSMKHCVKPNGKSFSHVFVNQSGNRLYVKMENSNYPRKPKDSVGGLGLNTFNKRMSLLYKDAYTYNTRVENEVYICELNITLKNMDKKLG